MIDRDSGDMRRDGMGRSEFSLGFKWKSCKLMTDAC
jgi:hypothetical protein